MSDVHKPTTVAFTKGKPVTPGDAIDMPGGAARGLYIGTAGDLAAIMGGNDDLTSVIFKNLAVGLYPFVVRRVLATGTTASNIVAVY
jgi:hypothetical protein